MRRRGAIGLVAAACLLGGGCGGLSEDAAVRLVRRYNDRVIEAFRTSDPSVVEPVVGPAEARKLAALIGAKADEGLTLDATLLELAVERVARARDEVQVTTRERWRYAHRRIGTGLPAETPTEDRYQMTYELKPFDGVWRVERIRFASAPVTGRKAGEGAGAVVRTHGAPAKAP